MFSLKRFSTTLAKNIQEKACTHPLNGKFLGPYKCREKCVPSIKKQPKPDWTCYYVSLLLPISGWILWINFAFIGVSPSVNKKQFVVVEACLLKPGYIVIISDKRGKMNMDVTPYLWAWGWFKWFKTRGPFWKYFCRQFVGLPTLNMITYLPTYLPKDVVQGWK